MLALRFKGMHKAIAPETRGRGSDRKDSYDSELPTSLRATDNHVVIRPAEGDTG